MKPARTRKNPEYWVAYHEAGHVAAYLDMGKKFHSVTIIPDSDTDGKVNSCGEKMRHCDRAVIDFSGPFAEARYRKKDPLCCGIAGDIASASASVKKWAGMLSLPDEEVALDLEQQARWIVKTQWDFICRIADKLIERKTLMYDDVVGMGNASSR